MVKDLSNDQNGYSFKENREWLDMIREFETTAALQISETEPDLLNQSPAVSKSKQLLITYFRMLASDLAKLQDRTRELDKGRQFPGYIEPYILQQQARIIEQGKKVLECFAGFDEGQEPVPETNQELIRLDSHLLDYQLTLDKIQKIYHRTQVEQGSGKGELSR